MIDKLKSTERTRAGRQATLSIATLAKARAHLRNVDPAMATLMKKVGRTQIRSEADKTVYHLSLIHI